MDKKMSAAARIWLCLCMAACLALAIGCILLFQTPGSYPAFDRLSEGQQMLLVLPYFVMFAGYLVLMLGKKAGFYIVLAAAVVSALYLLSSRLWLPALFCLVNPAVTWLLLRGRWGRWKELDERTAREKRQNGKPKSRKLALFLAAFPPMGFLGVDRFYLGYAGLGLVKFLTAGGLLVLYIMDIVKIAKGTMTDRWGRPLE